MITLAISNIMGFTLKYSGEPLASFQRTLRHDLLLGGEHERMQDEVEGRPGV